MGTKNEAVDISNFVHMKIAGVAAREYTLAVRMELHALIVTQLSF